MPSAFSQALQARNESRDYLRHGRSVFEVRPIVSADLWQIGYAELEGSAAYAAEMEEARREGESLRLGLGAPGLTAERRAEIEASLLDMHQRRERARLQAWLSSDKSRRAYLERCDAHLCASVTRAGLIPEDVELPDDMLEPAPTCIWPVVLEDVTLVRHLHEADYAADRVPVADLGEVARVALGSWLIRYRSLQAAREVRPFRAGSAARIDCRSTGAEVRPVASRGGEPDAGAAGDRAAVHGGGRG